MHIFFGRWAHKWHFGKENISKNEFLPLNMPSTSSCRCDARVYLHAHCYCSIYNCNDKAVSLSTYQHHRKAAEESQAQILNSSDLQEQTSLDGNEGAPGSSECNSDSGRRFIYNYSCWRNNNFCQLSKKCRSCTCIKEMRDASIRGRILKF